MQFYKSTKNLPLLLTFSTLIIVGTAASMALDTENTSADSQEISWLTRLASSGDSGAQLQLGLAYENGRYGISQDIDKSDHWLDKAAQNGNAYAADLLANRLADKKPEQLNKAAYFWKKAAQQGNADAQLHLGEYLEKQGDKHALFWLRKAADLGDKRAQQDLATLYRTDNLSDTDLHRGENKLAVLGREFNSTSIKAFFTLWHLIKASSVLEQSTEALMARAKKGDPLAEFQLALRYRDGAWDVNPDQAKSIAWLKRSAAAGNRLARQDLAKIQQQTSRRDSGENSAALTSDQT
jgi:uncharacterized protein